MIEKKAARPDEEKSLRNGSFCHGDEENGRRACTSGHLTTVDQSEIRGAHLALL